MPIEKLPDDRRRVNVQIHIPAPSTPEINQAGSTAVRHHRAAIVQIAIIPGSQLKCQRTLLYSNAR